MQRVTFVKRARRDHRSILTFVITEKNLRSPICILRVNKSQTNSFIQTRRKCSAGHNADDLGVDAIGLGYSTNASETNFMFVHNDAATNTRTSTGVAIDTDPHFFIIHTLSATNIRLELWDVTRTTLEASTNLTTNLPGSGDGMRPHQGIESLSGADDVNFVLYNMKIWYLVP